MAWTQFKFSKIKRKTPLKKNRLGSVAKKTDFQGRKYDSKFEAKVAADLEWRKQAGEIIDIKPQFKIDIKVKGKHWRFYKIDFRVELAGGGFEYIEAKGFATAEWQMKWDLLNILKDELLEPGSKLILITQK